MRLELITLFFMAVTQDNEAEKLFRAMEQKLAKAKTVQVSFSSIVGETKVDAKLSGSLSIAEGNRFRLDVDGNLTGKAFKRFAVSDGTLTYAGEDVERAEKTKTPSDQTRKLVNVVGRMGCFYALGAVGDGDGGDEAFKLSGFRLGKKEKVEGRLAQVIDHQITIRGKEVVAVKLWLDSKTNLPLKRVITSIKPITGFKMTETYANFRVDAALDASRFELPLPAPVELNEAEKLFRAMETKLSGARTIQLSYSGTVVGSKSKGKFSGTLAVAEHNRFRYYLDSNLSDKQYRVTAVSNGSAMYLDESLTDAASVVAPEEANARLRSVLRRLGCFLFIETKAIEGANLDGQFKVSDFWLGVKDLIGGRPAQVIEFQINVLGQTKVAAKLWIDTETNLPLKRVLTTGKAGEEVHITENYTNFQINAALDPRKFDLPK